MSDDNPFASPDPGRLPGPPPGPPGPAGPAAWQEPAYQQWPPSPYDQPPRRGMRRSLVAACHASAVGAWLFVVSVWAFYVLLHGDDGGEVFVGIILLFVFGGVIATVLLAGLTLAVLGAVWAVPLYAIWRGERAADESSDAPERVAIFHAAVAWVVMAYVLIRLLA